MIVGDLEDFKDQEVDLLKPERDQVVLRYSEEHLVKVTEVHVYK